MDEVAADSQPGREKPMSTRIELKDLIGEHLLDAVDFSNEQAKTWGDEFEALRVMRFRMDGKVYTVTENPLNSYHSSMRDITAGDWRPMTNTFAPLRVVGLHRTVYYGPSSSADILELIDIGTGKIVIEVGTDNGIDYYPIFNPKAMTPNASREVLTRRTESQ